MDPKPDETMDIKCPRCKRRIEVRVAEAEKRGKVKCPCGEEIDLVKMI
jgi:hypothetical protein